jgi:hypothetical protein
LRHRDGSHEVHGGSRGKGCNAGEDTFKGVWRDNRMHNPVALVTVETLKILV